MIAEGERGPDAPYKMCTLFTDHADRLSDRERRHPIRVVKQGNYHVIVVTECSGVGESGANWHPFF